MPQKQKKTSSKIKSGSTSKSVIARKKAADDMAHLEFSITKNAKSHDYAPTSKKSTKKKESAKSIVEQVNKIDAKIDAIGSVAVKKTEHILKVNKSSHKRSPYVVRLLDEWETTKPANISSKSRIQDTEDSAEWIKEVQRLRKGTAASYKNKLNNISIDLLGNKSSKRKNRSIKLSNAPVLIGSALMRAIQAIIKWFFEFLLSIPLGFLLAFQVLLALVEYANKAAIAFGRSAGKGISYFVEQIIFLLVALIKAVVVIPIKLITLAILGIYRIMSTGGSLILWFGNGVYETFKNYFSVLLNPPKRFYQRLAVFIIIVGVIILPVKILSDAPEQIRILQGSVLGATKDGYTNIASIGDVIGEGQADAAQNHLLEAQLKFSQARDSIDSLNIIVRGMISVLPQGQDGLHAISAGEELTTLAQLITKAVEPLVDSSTAQGTSLSIIKTMQQTLQSALPHVNNVQSHLSEINPENLPSEFQDKFISARELLPSVRAAIIDVDSLSDTLVQVLGANGAKRYAVLFQNNNELRPAGGFIGSLAFVDIRDGVVENIEIPGGGSYDFQGYLSEHIEAPKPLQLVNARWELQDSNWYPDWPTSAEKAAWFIEKSGHSSVDGVIALQATTLVKLLEILGPMEFEQEEGDPVVLTSANVLDEIQREVEIDYDKQENQPKKYIAELAPRVLEKILSSQGKDQLAMLGLIKSEIEQKNILLYFRDSQINQSFIDRGWEPSIISTDLDYLSIIHANIGGGKTDGVISESWDQEIIIDEDGSAIAELTIIRQHNGDPNNIFESYNNVDFVRVYAPEGSELISFTGVKPPAVSMFKEPESFYTKDYELTEIEGNVIIHEKTGTRITNEFKKTVFGNWLQVDPGNILVSKIKYKLPFKVKPFDLLNPQVKSGYSLLIQKQAGARSIPYSISLRYPSNWEVSWSQSVGQASVQILGPGLTIFEGDLSKDTGFSVLFGK